MTTAPAVTVAIEAHHIDPKLHRVLAEQIPRTGQFRDVEAINREIHTLVRAYLESRQGDAQDRPRHRDLHLRQRDRLGRAQHGAERGGDAVGEDGADAGGRDDADGSGVFEVGGRVSLLATLKPQLSHKLASFFQLGVILNVSL